MWFALLHREDLHSHIQEDVKQSTGLLGYVGMAETKLLYLLRSTVALPKMNMCLSELTS